MDAMGLNCRFIAPSSVVHWWGPFVRLGLEELVGSSFMNLHLPDLTRSCRSCVVGADFRFQKRIENLMTWRCLFFTRGFPLCWPHLLQQPTMRTPPCQLDAPCDANATTRARSSVSNAAQKCFQWGLRSSCIPRKATLDSFQKNDR